MEHPRYYFVAQMVFPAKLASVLVEVHLSWYASSMSAESFGMDSRCQFDIHEPLLGVCALQRSPVNAQGAQLATSSGVRLCCEAS
jgi:hypothetical protein